MWSIIKKHPVAVVAAVLAHLIFIGVLFFNFDIVNRIKAGSGKNIEYITAKAVDEKALQARLDKKKHEEERKKEATRKAKEAKLKAQREKQLKKKRAAEKKRKAIEKKRLAELEKKRRAEKKKKAALKKQEEERKREEEKRKEQERIKQEEARVEAELKIKMEADREARAKAAATRQSEIGKYERLIRRAVERHWKVPSGADEKLKCVVQVRIIPSGDVIDVRLIKSSGSAAFDTSVENAVYRASPLPVPAAESGYFENFREVNFEFSPRNRL